MQNCCLSNVVRSPINQALTLSGAISKYFTKVKYTDYRPVQVGVSWSFNIKVSSADVIDSLVVNHEGTIRVLECGMSSQNRVVGLNNCS